MSERRAGLIDRWRRRLTAERLTRGWPAAAAKAVRERWDYLSLVLVVVLTLVTVDLARENRNLRGQVRWYVTRETSELPGALAERTPEPPPSPPPAPAAEAAVTGPAAVPVLAAAARPEDACWPVAGQLLQGFGWLWSSTYADYRFHPGADFRAPDGAEVRAALPGKIKQVRQDRLWGHRVELDHGEGLKTIYAHLGRVNVRAGDWVDAGQVLGRVGPPGEAELADGTHLHFELHVGGEPVDPGAYLK